MNPQGVESYCNGCGVRMESHETPCLRCGWPHSAQAMKRIEEVVGLYNEGLYTILGCILHIGQIVNEYQRDSGDGPLC